MEDEVHRAAEHLLLAMRPSHNKLIIMGCASRGKGGGGIARKQCSCSLHTSSCITHKR